MLYEQKVTLTVRHEDAERDLGNLDWTAALRPHLDGQVEVTHVEADEDREIAPKTDINRLFTLVGWAAAEKAKHDAGLPSEWQQGHWLTWSDDLRDSGNGSFCGTQACIAGRVALEDGWKPRSLEHYPDAVDSYVVKEVEGRQQERYVSTVAREALGITATEADALFDGGNELDDITRVVQAIAAARQDGGRAATRVELRGVEDDEEV